MSKKTAGSRDSDDVRSDLVRCDDWDELLVGEELMERSRLRISGIPNVSRFLPANEIHGGDMLRTTILLTLLLALAFSQNLLTNGDFEQDLSVGWTRDSSGYGVRTTDRQADLHPDPDYEARCSLYSGAGSVALNQRVNVPHPWLAVSFQARFDIVGTSSSCWPVAYVGIGYFDNANNLLGETRIYHHDSYCTWVPTGTLSLIEVTNPDWTQYDIDVGLELSQHLPGVNPADIRQVRISLADTTAGG